MVDVAAKPDTARQAVAEGFLALAPEALALVREGHTKRARARLTGGWTYHANGGGFPDCWHSGNQYRTYPGDVPGTSHETEQQQTFDTRSEAC